MHHVTVLKAFFAEISNYEFSNRVNMNVIKAFYLIYDFGRSQYIASYMYNQATKAKWVPAYGTGNLGGDPVSSAEPWEVDFSKCCPLGTWLAIAS